MTMITEWMIPIIIQASIIWVVLCAILVPSALLLSRKYPGLFRHRHNPQAQGLGFTWILALITCAAYISGVVAFTFLPLPDPDTFQCDNNLYYTRYFAGWSIEFAFRNTAGMGIERFLSWWFAQIYLNVLLFVPWGFLARFLFKVNFRTALLSSFAASLLIELTQLTGVWGVYGCRYRTFDVDDLIANTLGGVLGFFCALGIEKYLHRRRSARPLSGGQKTR